MNICHPKLEWGSHVQLLLPCLNYTQGPVLELGCGHYSTSLLSLYSQSRYCRSIESNRQWHEKVRSFFPISNEIHHDQGHEILWTESYKDAIIEDRYWAMILIDHHSNERVEMAQRVREYARLVIVHDTNRSELRNALDSYRFRYDFTEFYPHTSIGSDSDDLEWLIRYLEKSLSHS